jgi:NAD(P)-dependent dehydrogenase (short-subunit alcohol dehydrogenase family)
MSAPLEWIDTPVTPFFLPDLKNKTALVTGSSQGIGRATTELLLQNGVRVFGLSLQRGELKHPNLTEFECDLSDLGKTTEIFTEITRSTPQLDYVVNVAGLDPKYPIDDVTVEQWDYLLDVNLRAYYFVIKMALPLLRKGSGRSIVNVSSINYRLSVPGRAAYAATKAAILGLTTGLSRELGSERIRVNTITPGWIFTERQVEEYFAGEKGEKHLAYVAQQQSLKLKISAAEIANHILFYLSSVSRASTAHNCVVDGGWLLE